MKKSSEYRHHARECRALAVQMGSAEQREQLLQMAEHWERLARDRLALIRKNPDLIVPDERVEQRDGNRSPSLAGGSAIRPTDD